jgi:protein-disulfide isomerase
MSGDRNRNDGALDLTDAVTPADHAIGPENARVTLVEYGDYECPDCLNAVPIVRQVIEQFDGQLRVVFRHFPLNSIHPHASAAARAAEAAHVQGRFWEMHEALFKNQKRLAGVDLTHLAINLGLEIYRFQSDMGSEAVIRRVASHIASGTRSGVTGTPTFFINGHRYRGADEFASIARSIEGQFE